MIIMFTLHVIHVVKPFAWMKLQFHLFICQKDFVHIKSTWLFQVFVKPAHKKAPV